MRAGIPVAQAIRGALKQKGGSAIERILLAVVADIEGGRTVSDAVSAFPELFPSHFVASLSVAEKTGEIPEAIGRHIDHIARLRELRRTIVAASVYPAVLLASMAVVVVFLLTYVLPSFARIYADSKVELPAMTLMFMALSDAIRDHWGWLAAGAAGSAALLRLAWRSPLRGPAEKLLYRAPMLGDILMDQAMARFCRTFSTLLKGGFPLLDSLRLSIDAVSGVYLRDRLAEVAYAVEGGESLGAAVRRSGAFSAVAVQLLEAGEKGGTLTPMLDEIADYSEEDLRHRVKVATTLLEPGMMIVVGLLVAGLVVAIYLPIFRIAGVSG
jgi:type IV pilus assembly protein PilC